MSEQSGSTHATTITERKGETTDGIFRETRRWHARCYECRSTYNADRSGVLLIFRTPNSGVCTHVAPSCCRAMRTRCRRKPREILRASILCPFSILSDLSVDPPHITRYKPCAILKERKDSTLRVGVFYSAENI